MSREWELYRERGKHFVGSNILAEQTMLDPANTKIYKSLAVPEVIVNPYGGASIAYNLSQTMSRHNKIAIMVAGNSGRPGGSVGYIGKTPRPNIKKHIKADYRVQEEDMVSNWLITTLKKQDAAGNEINKGMDLDKYFTDAIGGLWGLKYIDRKNTYNRFHPQGRETFQNVDYTEAEPWMYGDAWVVRDVELSNKELYKGVSHNKFKRNESIIFNVRKSFPCDLVFVAGPNAKSLEEKNGRKGIDFDSDGSVPRTWNQRMAENYSDFREAVKYAIEAGLDAMIKNGCDIAIVALVSGGLYAGTHTFSLTTCATLSFIDPKKYL